MDELLAMERGFWDAAGDPGHYRTHPAEDGVMAFHVGVFGKDDVVGSMDGAEAWESYTMDDLRVVDVATDVQALVYTTVARPAGAEEDYRAAITSVYARRDRGWKLVLHQQTPLG